MPVFGNILRDKEFARDWRWPAFIGASAFALAFVIAISSFWDLGYFLGCFVVLPLTCLALIIHALRVRTISALGAPFALCLLAWVVWKGGYDCRAYPRWWVASWAWKYAVEQEPDDARVGLKHIDWDGWGFAGEDTEVYLVSDPNDTLALVAARKASGLFAGVPCPVWQVRRLEKGWYAVTLYTDESWDFCPDSK